jgi:hypothetical protein
VLTSPIASAAAWLAVAGTGLSARAIRLGPATLAALPWPAGDVSRAAQLLRGGDVLGCGRAIAGAYACGRTDDDRLFDWWSGSVNRAAVSRNGSPTATEISARAGIHSTDARMDVEPGFIGATG